MVEMSVNGGPPLQFLVLVERAKSKKKYSNVKSLIELNNE